MKKLICILAGAALFGACEQKTETVTPAAPPVDNKKTETNTTIVNPPKSDTGAKEKITTTSTTNAPSPATSTETKTESTTTTTSSPNP